jgi:hypothetical protein
VELRPIGSELEISVPGQPAVRAPVADEETGWIGVGIVESARRDSWSLFIDGTVVLEGLTLRDSTSLLSNLLIFADGSLDLDAVTVVADLSDTAPGSAAVTMGPDAPLLPAGPALSVDGLPPLSEEERNALFEEAYSAAIDGRTADAVGAVARMVPAPSEDGRSNLAIAQQIGMLAYALRDGGRVQPARAVAFEALRYLRRSRGAGFAGPDMHGRATVDFVAGQIWEDIMCESDQAERAFRNAAAIDRDHSQAREAADRIARDRSLGKPAKTGGAP